jgi:hypothetical protein
MPDDQIENQEDPGRLRQLVDEANARAAQAEADATQLRSREMFRDAGLDPSKPLHAAAMRGYDGTLDPDAVTEYVKGLGITETAPPPAPVASQEEIDANNRMAQAAMGHGGPPPSPDRREQIAAQMADAHRRKLPKSEMDRLSEEYSRAGGFRVKVDVPGMT